MGSETNFECCFDEETNVESLIMGDGVKFVVNYIGCIEILTSMKLLDFQSRSLVAKECIHRVCDAASSKSPKKRRAEKRIQQCINTDGPCMEHSGANVVLTISSNCLELTSVETNEIVARHDMPNVSFASGGDSDAMSYVAYVAKDGMHWRACYVLECGNDKAQSVISTMGQAFELRYKNFVVDAVENRYNSKRKPSPVTKSETEYYNDLPGKVPPEFAEFTNEPCERRRERLTSNLIDLNTTIDYVNDESKNECANYNNNVAASISSGTSRDVFDMQCFSLPPDVQLSQLLLENWYHGGISRTVSESMLRNDGDFLVRESQGSPGHQYVLTGLNAGCPKHLLLIDPDGVVRTKDRVFESITHLINYHWSNRLPIISADSALLLRTPVIRTNDLRK